MLQISWPNRMSGYATQRVFNAVNIRSIRSGSRICVSTFTPKRSYCQAWTLLLTKEPFYEHIDGTHDPLVCSSFDFVPLLCVRNAFLAGESFSIRQDGRDTIRDLNRISSFILFLCNQPNCILFSFAREVIMSKHIDLYQCDQCKKLYYYQMDADTCEQRDKKYTQASIVYNDRQLLIPTPCPCGKG